MSRWIDAEWLEELFPDTGDGEWTYNATALGYIDSAPSIDIVRCEECKYGEVCSNYYDDGFCSTGERGKLKTIYNDGVVVAKLVCE